MARRSTNPRQASPTNHQAKVFRRRRIIVLVVLALLIWGIWAGVSAAVSAISGALGLAPTPGASGVSANGNNAAATPGVPTACKSGTVGVQAFIGDGKVPKNVFGAKANPFIWFNLTNNSGVACTVNAGTNQQAYKITSGNELIWTSRDCVPFNGTDAEILLQPGETKTSAASYWEKVHSSTNGCGAKTESPVVTGGASYHLVITVDGNTSNDVQFILN